MAVTSTFPNPKFCSSTFYSKLPRSLLSLKPHVFSLPNASSSCFSHLTDDDIEALVSDEIFQPEVIWSVGDLRVASGTLGLSTATVKLISVDGTEHIACSVSTGSVDAAYKAIDSIVKMPVTLLEYSLNSVT